MSRWYGAQLARRPLLTQSITTGCLFATGDITAQQLVEKQGTNHDVRRTSRMALYGTTVFGPVASTWFKFLANRVVLPNKRLELLTRVAMDQLIFAPTMICIFLSSMAVLEGGSPREKLGRSYLSALKANYCVWPLVQSANFTIIPLEHRLLFANTFAIGWNCYLSYLNSS